MAAPNALETPQDPQSDADPPQHKPMTDDAAQAEPTPPSLANPLSVSTEAETLAASNSKASPFSRWPTLASKVYQTANQKIDITIGRLTFIIGIVALTVAVLSYYYGAASYHVAERAYELQQLEFCKDHGDDPQIAASKHCQRWVSKSVDSVLEKKSSISFGPAERNTETEPADSSESKKEQMPGICRTSNPFDVELQCVPQLRSKGISRVEEVSNIE
ncbi:MAG: hypothetical protein Q9225_005430 [Loekoesia sp. 1 TL-2023]